jgi:hypothetical protein
MLESARARNDPVLAGFIGTRLGIRLDDPPGHTPQFKEVFVETRDGSRFLRATLNDLGADVTSFQGAILYGRRSPLLVLTEWSWGAADFFSRDVGTGLTDLVDPSKEYLVRLMARDSTGSETVSEFALRGDQVRPAGEKRSTFSTAAVLAGTSTLAAVAVGWHWAYRRRHARN